MAKQNDNAKRVQKLASTLIDRDGEACSLQIARELGICPGEAYRCLCASEYRRVRPLYWAEVV